MFTLCCRTCSRGTTITLLEDHTMTDCFIWEVFSEFGGDAEEAGAADQQQVRWAARMPMDRCLC